jgi:hypothetical protein
VRQFFLSSLRQFVYDLDAERHDAIGEAHLLDIDEQERGLR